MKANRVAEETAQLGKRPTSCTFRPILYLWRTEEASSCL